ncbi:MAG TPA: DsrE family protein [Aliidongia sp.]|nr:DsrE family protein [Aliidongia sp.]
MPRFLTGLLALLLILGLGAAAETPKHHRLAVQIDSSDSALMNLALGNIANAADLYAKRGETVEIELVAYGPGLAMLREDISPVKARLEALHEKLPTLKLSACHNTLVAAEASEGKHVVLVPEAAEVPSGVVRLVELQEQGWSYIRP